MFLKFFILVYRCYNEFIYHIPSGKRKGKMHLNLSWENDLEDK